MIRCWSAGRQSLFSFMIKNNKNGEIKLNKTKTRPEKGSVRREILCLLFFCYSVLARASVAASSLDVSPPWMTPSLLVGPVFPHTKTEVLSCLSEMNVADIRTCFYKGTLLISLSWSIWRLALLTRTIQQNNSHWPAWGRFGWTINIW